MEVGEIGLNGPSVIENVMEAFNILKGNATIHCNILRKIITNNLIFQIFLDHQMEVDIV